MEAWAEFIFTGIYCSLLHIVFGGGPRYLGSIGNKLCKHYKLKGGLDRSDTFDVGVKEPILVRELSCDTVPQKHNILRMEAFGRLFRA